MAESSRRSFRRKDRPNWVGRLIAALLGTAGLLALIRYLTRLVPREEQPGEFDTTETVDREPAEEEPPPGPEEVRDADGRLVRPSVQRETTDISFWGILIGVLLAAGFAALHMYLILSFFRLQLAEQRTYVATPYGRQRSPAPSLPPSPRIEQIDRMENIDTSSMYLREKAREEVLHRFGPTSEQGFVHIPIEQAIRQAANQLPARPAPPSETRKSAGLVDWGESNSGRLFRGGGK
jgi:hypothetical protein